MKKNNGFTLIELLATIIILAGIALVAFPILLNTIKNSEDKIDGATKRLVENAAKLFVDNNLNDYPKENGNTYCIPFSKLIEEKHLEKGILDSANVDADGKTVKITVTNDYSYEIVNSGDCTIELVKTCIYQGTDETKKYDFGAEYKCKLGDGEERTFYVLEDGNTTSLTKGTTGTAGIGEVSLIMDRNFTDGVVSETLGWCIAGGTDNATCQSINSKETGTPLKHIQDTFGNNVTVSFPTVEQIATASGKTFSGSDMSGLKTWLYDGLKPIDKLYGYWTASPYGGYYNCAWYVRYDGGIYYLYTETSRGIRPVITISKEEIN